MTRPSALIRRSGAFIRGSSAVLLAVTLVAACATTGSLGTVPPQPASTSPSVEPGGPDLTPGPSIAGGPTPSAVPSAGSASASPTASPGSTVVVRAYFLVDGQQDVAGLVPTLRNVPDTQAVARAAMGALLGGPVQRPGAVTLSTSIPAGTSLLDLTIRNGIATVDLSRDFESDSGSASSRSRLAQVVYTLTQFTGVRSVLFQVEGRTVTTFGSEGVVLDGPQARADFVDQLPSIFVDRPAFGAAIGNPSRVTGTADVFEATFLVSVIDGAGHVLADQQVMATCGSGCRGTFDATVSYRVSKAQWGTLRAYNRSAQDGSPESIRDYPVWLTPAG